MGKKPLKKQLYKNKYKREPYNERNSLTSRLEIIQEIKQSINCCNFFSFTLLFVYKHLFAHGYMVSSTFIQYFCNKSLAIFW